MQVTDAMVAKAVEAAKDSMHDLPGDVTEANYDEKLGAVMRAALTAALAEMWRYGEVKARISSACLSYRHDYGLLTVEEQEHLRFEAKEWLNAWRKELSPLPAPPMGK